MSTRLHRSEVNRWLGAIQRAHGIRISRKAVEAALGYPLVEAGFAELVGVIAGLKAVASAESDGAA